MREVVLASGSPRRRRLLARLGLEFEVVVSGVNEDLGVIPPEEVATRLAEEKAAAVAELRPKALVLGADTTIDLDGRELGKPRDAEDAENMLRRLRDRWHGVVTGLALVDAATGRRQVALVKTRVRMRDFSDAEMADYIRSGEPMDKAGAYAIQGLGGRLVESLQGCFFNVVGLPLCEVARLLRSMDVEVPEEPAACRTEDDAPCPLW